MQDTSQLFTTKMLGHRINAVATFKPEARYQRKGTNKTNPSDISIIFKYEHKTYYYYQRKQKMFQNPAR